MNVLERVFKPAYVFQPRRFLRRILGHVNKPGVDGLYHMDFPWGIALTVRQLDVAGHSVALFGIYDLVVTEAIWRLVEAGDTVVDVGAHVGCMTLAMMARLESSGRIFSFEPNPEVLDELLHNIEAASRRFPGVNVTTCTEALSDRAGAAAIHKPRGYETNRGLAQLRLSASGDGVVTRRLDDYASEIGNDVALMKIDVEGHEAAVLRGAGVLLERGVFRHIIIEEHGAYPTEATTLLERCGYRIFAMDRSLLRVRLTDPAHARRSTWEAPSLLATRQPDRVRDALAPWGWRALSS